MYKFYQTFETEESQASNCHVSCLTVSGAWSDLRRNKRRQRWLHSLRYDMHTFTVFCVKLMTRRKWLRAFMLGTFFFSHSKQADIRESFIRYFLKRQRIKINVDMKKLFTISKWTTFFLQNTFRSTWFTQPVVIYVRSVNTSTTLSVGAYFASC